MKIERIDENKIKITVSIEDLVERNINVETLNYNSREAQELFWDMMRRAEMEFGFNASDAQLCIEAVPNSMEGFVITITRVEDDVEDTFESIQKYIRNKYKKSDLRIKKRARRVSTPIMIYSFTSMDDLKALTSRIVGRYSGESTLFRLKNTYYLILSRSGWTPVQQLDSIVQEYGRKVSYTNFYEGYLEEYATKISDQNALDIVASFY